VLCLEEIVTPHPLAPLGPCNLLSTESGIVADAVADARPAYLWVLKPVEKQGSASVIPVPGLDPGIDPGIHIAVRAEWRNPEDVKASYPKASILKTSRVVFNIKGNDYRLIARVQYQAGALAIRFFGTHAEYDRIDAETV